MNIIENKDYLNVVQEIKNRVHKAQVTALRAVNTELVSMYWDIGKLIIEKQKEHNWGDSVVEKLADDLNSELVGKGNFTARNLYFTRDFYLSFSQNTKVSQLGTLLPWGHIKVILSKKFSNLEFEYYIKSSIKNGWSRSTLESKIKNKDFESWAVNQSNVKEILPLDLSAQAEIIMRDDVDLSFLNLEDQHKELELEDKIVQNITKFLAVMGGDFSFVGRQVPVELEGKEYRIDLLFYHRALQCLFVIELKAGEFEPEFAGKLGFYLALIDDKFRKPHENPSIGIILCKNKKRSVVEYSLKFMTKPMGVTTYEKSQLPENISKYLPSEEEITRRLSNILENENHDQ